MSIGQHLEMRDVMIVMGSRSDWETMVNASRLLHELKIPYGTGVVSAHRTPQRLTEFVALSESAGVKIIIAGAGGAAHLPGMLAANTCLPVIAVPVESKLMQGLDSLLSIVQMPRGVAVAAQAVGQAGAFNAGLMAAQILALSDAGVKSRLRTWRLAQAESVPYSVED